MSLVMRLETAAAKFDRRVCAASKTDVQIVVAGGYDLEAADMRDLLLEAARRLKELERAVDEEYGFLDSADGHPT